MIGTIFLENYYLILGSRESTEENMVFGTAQTIVGLTKRNPENIILDAHYNPLSHKTDWLPEARETDMSHSTADWANYNGNHYDVYDFSGRDGLPSYEEAHNQRLYGKNETTAGGSTQMPEYDSTVGRAFLTGLWLVMCLGVACGCFNACCKK
jgi:hypothetical protein